MGKLPLSFYLEEDVVQISRDLLGKFLFTDINNEGLTGGMIVETEAYAGVTDKASHAYKGRLTDRTRVMYEEGGVSYIYLIYGFYNLFNIITNHYGVPHAVLIRAIEPTEGIKTMLKRRKMSELKRNLTAGPGLLTQALGITRQHNNTSLLEDTIWLEDHGVSFADDEIICSPRVNIGYAEEDALLPWRFRVRDHAWTSKAR